MKQSKLLFESEGERRFLTDRQMPTKLMENCPFHAHVTLLVIYLEAVAWLKHPWHDRLFAGILTTMGVCPTPFHCHLLFNGIL